MGFPWNENQVDMSRSSCKREKDHEVEDTEKKENNDGDVSREDGIDGMKYRW